MTSKDTRGKFRADSNDFFTDPSGLIKWSGQVQKEKVPKSASPPLVSEDLVPESLARSLVRETLLLEELTKSDKKEIERIAKKQAAAIVKRDALDKQEIEKLALKKAEEAIKKALGVSFIGTKGDINKFVADNAELGAEKWLKDKAGKQQVADVTKLIFKKLYKQLAVTSPQVIDRIKV